MTQFLPPNLLALFEARPPILYLPPPTPLLVDKNAKLPESRFEGLAEFVKLFEDPADTPPKPVVETKEEKKARKRREKDELLAYKVEQGIAQWNPAENPKATEDPYKTLFVSRINYETSEGKLKRELEQYGKIKKLSVVHDLDGKPRGYAFVEFNAKEDMHNAYKRADGQKIDGRRIAVDYERGRTQKSWLPRRLGGGKGDTRRARESRKAMEERDAANGVEPTKERERGDRDRDRRDRGGSRGDRGDRDRRGSSSRKRSRSRERGGDRDRRDRGDRGERGGYRGGPPAVESYAGGAGGHHGGGGGYRGGGYGGGGGGRDYGGGGRDYGGRDSYGGGGGYGNSRDNHGGEGRDRRY